MIIKPPPLLLVEWGFIPTKMCCNHVPRGVKTPPYCARWASQLAALILLFFSFYALGADEFGVEQPFEKPDKIPSPVVSYLSKNLAKEINLCELKNIDDAFEAKFVKISNRNKALVIKPKAWCLCGVYNCPVWLFQIKQNIAKPILYSDGTSGLDILDIKTNGYRQIKDYGVHGRETSWVWNGTKYRETVTKFSTRNEAD